MTAVVVIVTVTTIAGTVVASFCRVLFAISHSDGTIQFLAIILPVVLPVILSVILSVILPVTNII
jgi:hypothetical protein